jgi:hypothetical protein
MTWTKADLAQEVAQNCGFMKHEAQEIVENLLETINSRPADGVGQKNGLDFGRRLWLTRTSVLSQN